MINTNIIIYYIEQKMDTETIVKRIMQLKKVSVELKQSTEDPTFTNTDFVKNILKVGMHINPMHYSSYKEYNNMENFMGGSQKSASRKNSQYKFIESPNTNPSISKTQSYSNHPELDTSYRAQSSLPIPKQLYQDTITTDQQITELKNQNHDLEEEIKNLQQKLRKLEEIQKQEAEEQWKDGLPYFVIHIPKVLIFYTKLTIAEKDYDKIDYKLYTADLNLEKIILSQITQPSVSNRPAKTISLQLSDLKEVSYHVPEQNNAILPFNVNHRIRQQQQNFLVIYHFKYNKNNQSKSKGKKSSRKSSFFRHGGDDKIKEEEFEIIETLFIKFDNEQQYKQWDLGVFINYKIMEDISKGDFKFDNRSSLSNSGGTVFADETTPDSRHKSDQNQSFKNLLQKYGSKSRQGDNSKEKQINNSIEIQNPISEFEDRKYNNIEQYLNQDSFSAERKTPRGIKKLNSNIEEILQSTISPILMSKQKRDNIIKIKDQLESPTKQIKAIPERASIQEIANKQRSDTSHFGTLVTIPSVQDKIKQTEKEQKDIEQEKKLKQIQLEEQKKKDEERMEAMRKTQYELSVKKAKQSLRKGYQMTKYAKSARKPYEKRIYLNEDGKRLCWQDMKNPGEPKWIVISQITGIKQGEIGKGIEQHVDIKKIKKGCFVTIFLNSKDRKTLELGCKDQLAMEQFCKDLQLYRQSLY